VSAHSQIIRNISTTDLARRRTSQFFWAELFMGTLCSIASNVTHAVLRAGPSGQSVWIAAAVALVPPVVLLSSTHSASLLLRIRGTGTIYWCSLAMTVGLAGCAFALSFSALQDLAASTGAVRPELAWLWPLAVDLSIAHATFCLLAVPGDVEAARTPVWLPEQRARTAPIPWVRADEPDQTAPTDAEPELDLGDHDFAAIAEALVAEGRSRQDPRTIAEILTLHEAREMPAAIASQLGLSRSVVNRVISASRDVLPTAV
jgi:hypothetical protein